MACSWLMHDSSMIHSWLNHGSSISVGQQVVSAGILGFKIFEMAFGIFAAIFSSLPLLPLQVFQLVFGILSGFLVGF